ncbi:hypothetical protein HA402_008936 [Bradysia odoriphaga]|nr:hypothetical protein HA402_008936 [Bradysia odoriphaga]
MSAYCVDPLVSNGYRVIVVEYDLCPTVTLKKVIQQITECGRFILNYAERMQCGQLTFCGHSAGAHLILCMIENIQRTSVKLVPIYSLFLISGIYDLTELQHTSINKDNILTIDASNVDELSPLKFDFKNWSRQQFHVNICVAENDSNTFIKQSLKLLNRLNANEMKTKLCFIENCDHFDIVEKLSDESFELTQDLLKNRS